MHNVTSKDIGYVVDNRLCLSCGACAAACSKKAITLHETLGGYLYPKVDYLNCVHCGLCLKVCPGVQYNDRVHDAYLCVPHSESILEAYVGRSLDEEIYENAQSGGVVTGILKDMLQRNAVDAVLCAVMTHAIPPRGEAILIGNPHKLLQAQKSKYVPVPLLKNLREQLKVQNKIAVVGLPCHMQGLELLKSALPEIEDKIVLRIGLVCDRILTAKSIDWLTKQATEKPVSHIIYRDKTRSGYPGDPSVETNNGEIIMLKAADRMAIKDFFTPVRCRLCLDKLNVKADIVCGDPHGVEGVDRINGETLVLVRNERGKHVIEDVAGVGKIDLRSVSVATAVNGQCIDQRVRDWKAYLQAWKGLEMPLPEGVERQQVNGKKILKVFENDLKQGLTLDTYDKASVIYKAAAGWLRKKRLKIVVLDIFKIIRNVFVKIVCILIITIENKGA
ncbi:MAG: Coenzyme F420 hydrogenase/dehydrogenase, beta subunit C-terminal domain [Chlorobium sp.]|uniref:Coenzyme F420 hydrogenase/dehydrogenase, beta subunit C-terminal domain n=1 Tax=Chlorobium sp. TaxID=1095 RepID=UPI002F3F661B